MNECPSDWFEKGGAQEQGGEGANHGEVQASREGVVNLVSFLFALHLYICLELFP